MLVRPGRGRTLGQRANERDHFDDDGFVVVPERWQGLRNDNVATQFLANFPNNGRGGLFAGFNLATGKFPLEWQVFVRRALREENAALLHDQRTDNRDGGRGGHAALLNNELPPAATFLGVACFQGMKTFFKIFLIVVLALLAIKFIPVAFVGAFVGLILAAILGAVGLSLVAALLAVGIALAMALSPIWIPGLIVMGVISLFKKLDTQPQPPVLAA